MRKFFAVMIVAAIAVFIPVVACAVSSGPINGIDFSAQPLPYIASPAADSNTFDMALLAFSYDSGGYHYDVAYFVSSHSRAYVFGYGDTNRVARVASDDPLALVYQISSRSDGRVTMNERPASSFSDNFYLYYSTANWGSLSNFEFVCPQFNTLADGLSYLNDYLGISSSSPSFSDLTYGVHDVFESAKGLIVIIIRSPLYMLLFCFPIVGLVFIYVRRLIR